MIKIEYIKYTPIDFTTNTTDYLLAVKDERIQVEIKFKAVWKIDPSDDILVSFSGSSILVKDTDGEAIDNIWANNEFKVGDLVTITGSTSNNVTTGVITSFSEDGSIAYFASPTFASETDTANVTLSGATVMTGVTYRHNFIENEASESYNSLVDGNENRHTLSGISSTSYVDLIHQGVYKSNKIGSVQIKSTGVLNEFILLHTTNVIPFALGGELTNYENEIAPDYYFDSACLKYIYEISLHKALANPNYIHQSTYDAITIANTGWRGENFNGGIPEYTHVSTVFKNALGETISAPEYNKINTVEIIVNSASGRFSNSNTKFTLQHGRIPTDTTEHTDTATDMETNFMFDQNNSVTLGAAAVNGRGFATNKQVLKTITGTYQSATRFKVTAKIDLSSYYQTAITSLDKNFYLTVTTQDHTKQTEDSDKVNIPCYVGEYTINNSDNTAGDIDTVFVNHSNLTYTKGAKGKLSNELQATSATASTNWILLDVTNNKTIATADFDTDIKTTLENLVDSLNNNVSNGLSFAPNPSFINNSGYSGASLRTAQSGIFTLFYISLNAPIGESYNGVAVALKGNAGDSSSGTFSGGVDEVGVSKTKAGLFVEDWQIGVSTIYVKKTPSPVLKNIAVRIYAEHSTYGQFDIENRSFATESAPFVSGIQVINIQGERGYKMGTTNPFNKYSILRDTTKDTNTYYAYELRYCFKIRWEDFIALAGVSSQFYNPSESNNGLNNDWNHYFVASGWALKYEVKSTITSNDYDNVTTNTSDVEAYTYGDATDWTYTIKTYDLETGTEISGVFLSDKKSIVKAFFQKISGVALGVSNIQGWLGVAPDKAGGDKLIREVSTIHEYEITTPWVSITNNKLCKKEKVSSDFILSAIIDPVKLKNLFPTANTFAFTARIEEVGMENAKVFQGGQGFAFQGGEQFLFNI